MVGWGSGVGSILKSQRKMPMAQLAGEWKITFFPSRRNQPGPNWNRHVDAASQVPYTVLLPPESQTNWTVDCGEVLPCPRPR